MRTERNRGGPVPSGRPVEVTPEDFPVRKLDLSDPMVRDMADRNHEPDELWAMSGRLLSMHCRTCGQSWPCETRRAVDAWRDWHRPRSIFEPRLIAGSPPDPNPWPRAGRFWLFRGWKR